MTETPEERARRLGLVTETPDERAKRLGLTSAPHSKFTPAQLVGRANRQVENAKGEEDVAADGTPATRALGTLTSLSRDVPGAEAMQAKVRSLVRRQPYGDALAEIRGAEDTAGPMGSVARVVGGGMALAALPGGAATKGALYGGLAGLGEADEESGEERVGRTLVGAGIGGLAGAGASKAAKIGLKVLSPLANAGKRAAGAVADAGESLQRSTRNTLLPPEALRAGEPAVPRKVVDAVRASTLTRDEAKSRLQALLQKNLDEGITARDAPPPTDWALMERMERGLVKSGGALRVPQLRAAYSAFPPSP